MRPMEIVSWYSMTRVTAQFSDLSVACGSSVTAPFSDMKIVEMLQIGSVLQVAGRRGIFHHDSV